jgi:hypothetical protein
MPHVTPASRALRMMITGADLDVISLHESTEKAEEQVHLLIRSNK